MELKLKLKSGQEFVLDFSKATFLECEINNLTIKLGDMLVDECNEKYKVERILLYNIVLRDSENIHYCFPKEEISRFKKL